ncbi:MAG TPA: outer membrane beta-barrel protein, partial [Gemmataceae bacterium]|nr:outer membrane beta-barrel protein [Gemmataceae bacterium]
GEEKKDGEEEKKDEEKKDDRGCFMKMLDGTELGCYMKQCNLSISGWIEGSYTCSPADITNMPVVWNDRPNQLILNQWWVRIASPIDTESKCPSCGFQVDFMYGTDYRYILQRGFWNDQLLNSKGTQNFYGFDMPQAFVNYYDPNLAAGTEIRLGKFFCPFGYESIEGPTTPLKSRSYAFNWAPPFTHWGLMTLVNLDKQSQVMACLINGNDVMIGDPAEEWRGLFKYQWTSEDKKTTWAIGTSIGRGKFNTGEPFAPATVALANEPAGRNNINVFDFTASHDIDDKLTAAIELIYGYQYGVPANVVGGLIDTSKAPGQAGVAHWGSIAKYLLYKFDDKTTGVLRLEAFDDFEGQRTGFEGVYWAATAGLQYKPMDCLLVRPEIRYDYNDYSRPFDAGRRHGLFTATIDTIMKY